MINGLCELDSECPIEIDVADSPMFADLLTHWRGDSETVAELQGHLYQEVIELTRVEQHVFTFRQDAPVATVDSYYREEIVAYTEPVPTATFSVNETGPMRAIKIDEPPMVELLGDDNLDRFDKLDTAWNMEAIRLGKRHFRRTRIFLKMVWAAYKTARAS